MPVQPEWFRDALAAPVETGSVSSNGCRIAFRTWGDADRPGIVLVHGGGAHGRWWDHIAPLLTDGLRVVALDLSGHGDSGRRPSYSMELWADEVLDVADASGIYGQPLVIGHSMGGGVTFVVGALYSDRVAGIVVLDSAFGQRPPEENAASQRHAFGPLRVYPSREEALERFRTVPEQPASLPYVIEHIAETSLRPVDGGWSWKFDPLVFQRLRPDPEILRTITCRVALFRAQYGLATRDVGAQMYELLGRRAPVIEIPSAWHHIMLDQPLALVTGMRTLLADWDHSEPIRPAPGRGATRLGGSK
ncbi:MAG: alpha/beta hydrolase [Acidimicrobiales bacterium]|nr:alpha/beta hydrolase [Acidimicrobiales bacterium]